jgi:hypothetical protein
LAAVAFVLLAAPAAASGAHQTYLVCDNAHDSSYPTVAPRPGLCNLGLGQSFYDAQPVAGKGSLYPLALRHLHWHGWGHYQATATGRACNVKSNGSAVPGTCDHVTVQAINPQSIAPAGYAWIYQLIRVRHPHSRSEPYSYAFWYRPGTDY